MAGNPRLIVEILTDTGQVSEGVKKATSEFGAFGTTMGKLAAPAAVALAGVTTLGVGALNAASDVQQAFGGLDAVFGKQAEQVKAWAGESANSVGLATAEYASFASTIGAQLKNLGVPMDQVAGNTDSLIKLGSDLAATYGGTTADAVAALSSALRGEADPAERYGLALNQTAVNAELAAQGLTGLEGQALTAAKAQAIMGLATEQAGGAVGQFGREADTVAGQQQRLNASWQDAAAELGSALLPVMAPIIGAFADLAGWVKQNSNVIVPLVAIVGALAAAILAINGAMIAWTAIQNAQKIATAAATAAQWAYNAALTANPIGIIIVAVAALIAGIIYLWNTNEDFRNFFISLWTNIANFFKTLWENLVIIVQSVAQFYIDIWNNVANFFKQVWTNMVNAAVAIINGIRTHVGNIARFFTEAWANAVKGVQVVFKVLGDIARNVLNAILAPINWIVDAFNNVVAAIKAVINWLGKIKIPDVFGAIGDFLGGGGGARSAGVAAFAGPSVAGFSALSAGPVNAVRYGGGGTVNNITVQGGLDSADSIARRIQQVMDARDRRTGGVRIERAPR